MEKRLCKECAEEKSVSEFLPKGRICFSCKKEKLRFYRTSVMKRERHVWYGIKERCLNPSSNRYSSYGGRGIKIDPRWDSFDSFYADMGSRPSPKHQIDRIDNDGDYSPENCRWVLPITNARNKTTTKLTMQKAEEIRILHSIGLSQKFIGLLYGVTQANISIVVRGDGWIPTSTKTTSHSETPTVATSARVGIR